MNRHEVAVFYLGFIPLAQILFMRFLYFILLLVSSLVATAQHPWAKPFANAADDLHFNLRSEKGDSICVALRPGRADASLPDSVFNALEALFAQKIEERSKSAIVTQGCSTPTPIQVTGEVGWRADGTNIRVAPEATNSSNDTQWSAVFFVPMTETLPEPDDIEEAFNPYYFDIPDLPAEASLLAMSGKVIEGRLISTEGTELKMEVAQRERRFFKRKKAKKKILGLHKSDVFSVTFPEAGEWVIYAPDDALGDDLTSDEMRIYIAGQQDASDLYRSRGTALLGFIVGAGGAIFASGGLLFTILPPMGYTAFQFVPFIRIKEHTIRNPEHRFNDVYAAGYERVARSKKLLGGLKGSGLGMLVGVATWFLVLQ